MGNTLDLDHTFEDRLEVLVQRLKEYQTLGKKTNLLFYLIIFGYLKNLVQKL